MVIQESAEPEMRLQSAEVGQGHVHAKDKPAFICFQFNRVVFRECVSHFL